MTEPKPHKKRPVPLTEYLRNRAAKIGWKASGITLMLLSSAVGIIVIWQVLLGLKVDASIAQKMAALQRGALLILIGYIGAFFIQKQGRVCTEKAKKIEEVELLKHANVGQLPVEETLVRASTEPTQEQEKVLLRAAMTSEDTPPEQLLRPGNPPN
jgi:hypothetical protein